MKLYAYDHCPFCVRARMIFGLKKLPFELAFLANDDEQTPISLIGKKAVPILLKNDGTAMPESLDIVRYVDQHFGTQILSETLRPEVEEWGKKLTAVYNHLLLPRFVKLGLAEFKQQSAIDYFVTKKSDYIGNFEENFAQSAGYIAQVQSLFNEFEPLVKSDTALNGELSLEDIIIFPMLRNLSCVKGVTYPKAVLAYTQKMAELSGVDLFFANAV